MGQCLLEKLFGSSASQRLGLRIGNYIFGSDFGRGEGPRLISRNPVTIFIFISLATRTTLLTRATAGTGFLTRASLDNFSPAAIAIPTAASSAGDCADLTRGYSYGAFVVSRRKVCTYHTLVYTMVRSNYRG